ncbi:MAG: RHS repeat-associated core domain-containing protein, partial [Cyclobacteriaceae bacterium]
YKDNVLEFFQHSEGRVTYNNGIFAYEYNLTDHLGNVRVTVDQAGTVIQKDDYYPFGMTFNSWTDGGLKNNYLNQGKEYQPGTGCYDYEARFYDPAIARWTVTDPLASYEPSWSPFRYGFNNPIRYVDPSGQIEVDQILDMFNNASSGYSSYDSDGNCTCGCPGKPDCDEAAVQFLLTVIAAQKAAEKAAEEALKKTPKFAGGLLGRILGTVGLILMPMNSSNPLDYIDDVIWSDELEQEMNRLAYLESQGRLTEQQKRDLAALRDKYDRLLLPIYSVAGSIKWKGFLKGQLSIHFDKHGEEFGEITMAEYLKLAKDFANESGNFNEKVVGAFVIKYDPQTGRVFVGRTDKREIRTFYKADGRSDTPFQDAVNYAKQISK